MTDLRRSTRHHVAIAAKLTVNGTAFDATILNLSIGGARATSIGKHAMGQRVDVTFKVPSVEHSVAIGAIVRWANGEGVGLQFDGLRARDVWALNEFFKQLP